MSKHKRPHDLTQDGVVRTRQMSPKERAILFPPKSTGIAPFESRAIAFTPPPDDRPRVWYLCRHGDAPSELLLLTPMQG